MKKFFIFVSLFCSVFLVGCSLFSTSSTTVTNTQASTSNSTSTTTEKTDVNSTTSATTTNTTTTNTTTTTTTTTNTTVKESFSIGFVSNGGTELTNVSVQQDDSGGDLPVPVKEGFIFMGWFYTSDFTVPYNPNQPVTNSFTVYALWQEDDGGIHQVKYVLLNDVYMDHLYVSTADSYNSQVFLLNQDRLYGFGVNWLGQMGNGTTENVLEPTNLTLNIPLAENETIIQMASGGTFTLALTSDNRLFGWGSNTYKSLGNTVNEGIIKSPVEITSNIGLNNGEKIAFIRAGISSTYIVTDQNRVLTWGSNTHGALGNNSTVQTGISQDISQYFNLEEGERIADIQLSYESAIAYTSNNRVFTWGKNDSGQLGVNSTVDSLIPVEITAKFDFLPLEEITAIGTGYAQMYLATSRSRVFGWGSNSYGQFGEYSANKLVPFLMPTDIFGDYVVSISGGIYQMVMATANGRVFTAGRTDYGVLGDGLTYLSDKTRNIIEITDNFPISNNEKVIQVGAANYNTYALTSSGNLYGFGNSGGYNIPDYQSHEELISQISNSIFLEEGETIIKAITDNSLIAGHYVVLTSANRIFVWGKNTYGQLGYTTDAVYTKPLEITALVRAQFEETIVDIAAGPSTTYLLSDSGRLIVFGYFSLGEGDSAISGRRLMPTDVTDYLNLPTNEYAIKIIKVSSRTYLLTNQNHIYAWGANQFGYLGDGTTTTRYTPVNITSGFALHENELIVDIKNTDDALFFLTSENRLFGLGSGYEYVLGNNDTSPATLPIDITEFLHLNIGESITQLVTGYRHVLVLTSNHRILAWGDDPSVDLDQTPLTSPKDISSLFDLELGEYIEELAAGFDFSIALTNQSRVLTWGSLQSGVTPELSVSEYHIFDITSQFVLSEGDHFATVFANYQNIILSTTKGKVFSWGTNEFGEIGNGTIDYSYTPTRIGIYEEEIYQEISIQEGSEIEHPVITDESYTVLSWYYDKLFQNVDNTSLMYDKSISLYGKKEAALEVEYYLPGFLEVSEVFGRFNKNIFFIVTTDHRVFSWGSNTNGMLGTGSTSSEVFPVDITSYFHFAEGETISILRIGNQHVVALTNMGNIFVWGDNSKGQCGHTKTSTSSVFNYETERFVSVSPNYKYPTNITNQIALLDEEYIIDVEVYLNATYVITSLNRIFAFGEVEQSPNVFSIYHSPVEVHNLFGLLEGEHIVSISEGSDFRVLLTNFGRVFTWGSNTRGQLGNGTEENALIPVDITSRFALDEDDYIVMISTSARTVLAVSNNNRIYMWGDSSVNNIPTATDSFISSPLEITSLFGLIETDNIIQIVSGYQHYLLLTDSGRIFSWGYNGDGNLGINHHNSTGDIFELTQIFYGLNENITSIAKAYNYSIVICESGTTYIWGGSTHDSLYLGDDNSPDKPIQIGIQGFTLYQIDYFEPGDVIQYLDYTNIQGFDGWFVNELLNVPFKGQYLGDKIELYSKWELVVSFESNGGTEIAQANVSLGEEVRNLNVPTKEGFYFGGWYEDSELTIRAKYIDSSMTLYARWLEATEEDFVGSDDFWYTYVDGQGYAIVNYDGNSLDLVAPRIYNDGYNGYDYVTIIGSYAFYEQILNSVQLPNTITTIDSYAFNRATIQELIFLGNAPENVDETAFSASDLLIYRSIGAMNWPLWAFYYENVRLIGDYPEEMNTEFFSQIELWNDSSLAYVDMIYSDPSIDWVDYMETKDSVQKSELIALSNSIVSGLNTDEEKVLAIYEWVSNNIQYSYDSAYLTEYEAYVSLSGVCFQYAQLVDELLRAQDIASVKVSGFYYSGFSDFESLEATTETLESSMRHAWNYVLVDGEWMIIDATHGRYDISEESYNNTLWAQNIEYVTYYVEGMDMSLRDGIFMIDDELFYIHNGLREYYLNPIIYLQDDQYMLYMSDPEMDSYYLDSWNGTDFIRGAWIEMDDGMYFAREDGQLYFDITVTIDGELYSFDEDGRLLSIIN